MTDDALLLDLPATPMPANEATGLTSKHMLEMLRKHYQPDNRPAAGILAPEIGSPCGKRRADLIWMPTTMAGGTGLHGHEIKVSRNDLLIELADPTKADPWAQYCTRWWLVVSHPTLISGVDIPPAWGVLAPPSGRRTRSMTVVRPAPDLKPKDPAPGLARLATWQLHSVGERAETLARDNTVLRRIVDDQRRELDQLRAEGLGRSSREAQKVARILSAVDQITQTQDVWGRLDEAAVVAALVDHQGTTSAARAVRSRLGQTIREVERLTKPLGQVLEEFRKAERLAAPEVNECSR